MTKRAPSWLPPISFVAIGGLVWAISFSSKKFEPFAVTAQLVLLLLMVRAFCYWPPLVRWMTSMPVVHRIVFGVLLGGLVLGHYTLDGRTYFPFVVWEIFPFVHANDPVTAREFIATTASGAKVRLIVEQQFPSIVQVDPIDALDDARLYPPGTTERVARALAKVYNERHTSDPVRAVDLMVMAVPLHPPANESRAQPSCELLQHYDISSAPSN